ncbi:MAG: hypothetical protein N3B18_13810 [Desulfobacterota bacterium]|nr:hypothetical protein [Thermodesulfobacteriota bacterium]
MAALCWSGVVAALYVRDWDPLTLHPLSLVFRELLILPEDVLAALVKVWNNGLLMLVLLLVIGCAAIGCGSVILTLSNLVEHGSERLVLSLALGLWAIASWTFGIGIIGLYDDRGRWMTWALLVVAALLGVRTVRRAYALHHSTRRVSLIGAIAGALLGTAGIFLFAKALRPALFYDAITYHLGVPNYYLLEGRITHIPHDAFSNFPFTAEMLFTLGMFLHGQHLAQLTSILVWWSTAWALFRFSKRFFPDISPWFAPVFFAATPALLENAVMYTNDLHLAYYTLITAYCFFLWEENPAAVRYLVLTGFCAGICLGIKYIAFICVLLPLWCGVWWITLVRERAGVRVFLYRTCWCALPALVPFMPWGMKNLIATGNPLYPGLYPLLGGSNMTPAQYKNIAAMSHPPSLDQLINGLWHNPARLFLAAGAPIQPLCGEWHLGPMLLIAMPLFIFLFKKHQVVRYVCAATLLQFFAWHCTFHVARFLYPCIVLALPAAAYALQRFSQRMGNVLSRIFIILIALLSGMGTLAGMYQVNLATKTFGLDFLFETDAAFLRRHMIDTPAAVLESLPVYTYINNTLDPGALVLIIGDAQHLYLQRRHRYAYLAATTPYDVISEYAPDYHRIAEALKHAGITHLVFAPHELQRLQRSGAVGFPESDTLHIYAFLNSSHVVPIYEYRRGILRVYLYELQKGRGREEAELK